MDSLFNSVCGLIEKIAGGSSSLCAFVFFEPEVPKSLREE